MCLFNIKEGSSYYEYMTLVTKMPDVLAQMEKKLQNYQATYFNPDRGGIYGLCILTSLAFVWKTINGVSNHWCMWMMAQTLDSCKYTVCN